MQFEFGRFQSTKEDIDLLREQLSEDAAFKTAEGRLAKSLNLSKSGAEFGSGPAHGTNFTGPFTPLVVQDLDLRITSEAYRDEHLVAIRDLPEQQVGSPLHEVITTQEYGDEDIEAFFAESGSPSVEESTHARKILEIRFLGVKRVVSDVATVTGIAGNGVVTKAALERETDLGGKSLNLKREIAAWNARKSLNPLAYDGLIEQIKNGRGLVKDMGGAKLSLSDLIQDGTAVAGAPGYGVLEKIYIPDSMYGVLVREATTGGRFQQQLAQPFQLGMPNSALQSRAGELILTPAGLTIIGSYGQPIMLRPAAHMNPRTAPPKKTGAVGDGPPAVVLGTMITGAPQVAAHSSSKFTAATAGTYRYKIIAYGDKGRTAHIDTLDVVVASGDRVKFDWADAAIGLTAGSGSLRSYAIYRSEKDKTTGFKRIDQFGRNTDGASLGTVFYDDNSKLPGGVHVAGLTISGGAIYMGKLLPTIRRPIAATETAQPFLLMTFEAPHVNHDAKQILYTNCDSSL